MDGHCVLCRVFGLGLGMTIWFSVLSVDCCVVQYVCSRFSLRSALCTFRIISGGCVALIEERNRIEAEFSSLDVR